MSPIVLGTNVLIGSDTPLVIDTSQAIRVTTDERGTVKVSANIEAPPARRSFRIESNVATTEGAEVEVMADMVRVRLNGDSVIEARRIGDSIHLMLDLRPLGLSIYSSEDALHVGSSVLVGNTIRTSGAAIVLSTGER